MQAFTITGILGTGLWDNGAYILFDSYGCKCILHCTAPSVPINIREGDVLIVGDAVEGPKGA